MFRFIYIGRDLSGISDASPIREIFTDELQELSMTESSTAFLVYDREMNLQSIYMNGESLWTASTP